MAKGGRQSPQQHSAPRGCTLQFYQLIDETSEEGDMTDTPEKNPEAGRAAPPPYPAMDYGFSQMNPAALQHNPHVPQPAPSPMVMAPPAAPQQTVVMVGSQALPPGVCTVCRVGKIKDTASCCTWFWCCILLPLGLIPGIIAFCCCCRHPKCTHCGYTVD
ncbi:membrane protein BRI3-like isoform X2 [Penaeus indicus]|uniref:membrane protein BRI3-like isoform X2 n=1 Tax=Penaeus indicus TaxID=29960 RepID=UPI00300D0783